MPYPRENTVSLAFTSEAIECVQYSIYFSSSQQSSNTETRYFLLSHELRTKSRTHATIFQVLIKKYIKLHRETSSLLITVKG